MRFISVLKLCVLTATMVVFSACSSSDSSGNSCRAQPGQCPNICEAGIEIAGGPCASSSDCACGFSCNGESGVCEPYSGQFEGCSCGASPMPMIDAGATPRADAGSDVDAGDMTCARSVPANFPCNPYCNQGCDAGQHCTLANNVFSCVPAGEAQAGATCNNSSDCAPGMACFRLTDENIATCRQFCIDDGDCTGGRRCDLNVNFGTEPHSFCGDISVGCDPFLDNPMLSGAGGAGAAGGAWGAHDAPSRACVVHVPGTGSWRRVFRGAWEIAWVLRYEVVFALLLCILSTLH